MYSEKPKVLFICHHNSGRSQMAEALLRMLYGQLYDSFSAGVIPTEVNPYAVKIMEQVGVDMSQHRSKSIDEFKDVIFDYVVTVCDKARETCPFFPGRNVLHHSISSASTEGDEAQIMASYAMMRDEIRAYIEQQFGPHSPYQE